MMVVNKIRECGSTNRKRVVKPWRLAIHRIGPIESVGGVEYPVSGAESLAAFFRDNPQVLGTPAMPYTFVLRIDGVIEQAVPLDIVTPHAWKRNQDSVGLAVVGDFRFHAPTLEQAHALIEFGSSWLRENPQENCLVGHDELPQGSKDPNKRCPGRYMNMDAVRVAVRDFHALHVASSLLELGVVFSI